MTQPPKQDGTKVEEFVKFLCARNCSKCKSGKRLIVNSVGFYSHSKEGNHCDNHQLLKAYKVWQDANGMEATDD